MLPKAKSYRFETRFARSLAAVLCASPRAWKMLGHEIEYALVKDPVAQLAIRAAANIAIDTGNGPGSAAVVVQRLHRWVDDGAVTQEQLTEVANMLIDEEIADPKRIDATIAEAAATLADHLRDEAVNHAVSAAATGDLRKTIALAARADRVGVSENANSITAGKGGAWEAIRALKDRKFLPIGVTELDFAVGGGLINGGLGIWLAGSGGGKSQALVHCAANAWRLKKFVGYVTLELTSAVILARAMGHITGIPVNDLTAGFTAEAEEVYEILQPRLGILEVADMPALITTPTEIFEWVDQKEQQHSRKMDLLVVDYLDKVSAPNARGDESGYTSSRVVYETTRLWLADQKKWGWSATQATRVKDKRKLLDQNDCADSLHKARICDLMISINVGEKYADAPPDATFLLAKTRDTGGQGSIVSNLRTGFAFGRLVDELGASSV